MLDLAICGVGAATAVGRRAWETAAAVRAEVSGLTEHPFMPDSEGKRIIVAQCPWLGAETLVENRIGRCIVDAIRESIEPLVVRKMVQKYAPGLVVNLPPRRPGLPQSLSESVQAMLHSEFVGIFSSIDVLSLGHAGGLIGLQSAITAINAGVSAYVVAGGDSYVEPDTLEWLEGTNQLHGAGPRNNAWGFVPGEGAGAILLVSAMVADRDRIDRLGKLVGLGIAREKNIIRSGEVCLGQGLTAAFHGAFSHFPSRSLITDVYGDMNGDPYRAEEYGFTVTRTRERFFNATDFRAPADCWGDVGAASGTLGIVLSCIASLKHYSNGSTSLVWASSEAGERAAAIIGAVEG